MHFNPNGFVFLVVLVVEYYIGLALFCTYTSESASTRRLKQAENEQRPAPRERPRLAELGRLDPTRYKEELSAGQSLALLLVLVVVAGLISGFGGLRALHWFLNLGGNPVE